LVVEKILRVVRDPANPNKILRNFTQRIALAVVTDLDEKSAVANVIERSENEVIKVGAAVTVLADTPKQ
jgi:Ethanolamine utilization protein EutJ (predicted chaperonin)